MGGGPAARLLPPRSLPPPPRDREPTAAVIDSQSVRAVGTVPRATRGWDNAKKVNGRSGTSPWTRWACCWPW
jgi:hypothetical protein